jgi:hypothetical protein
MTEEFLTVFRLLGTNGIDPDGADRTNADAIAQMRNDPGLLAERRCSFECRCGQEGRDDAENLIRLLISTVMYLSNLIIGPVPVLLPRDEVHRLAQSGGDDHAPLQALGRAVRQVARQQAEEVQRRQGDELLSRLEALLADDVARAIPAGKRYLDTQDVGRRLGITAKTARRLFSEGQLVGRRLASGKWRTTEAELARSPYLRTGGRRAAVE